MGRGKFSCAEVHVHESDEDRFLLRAVCMGTKVGLVDDLVTSVDLYALSLASLGVIGDSCLRHRDCV
jgi:hypothetical protein